MGAYRGVVEFDDARRLKALRDYRVLDSEPEEGFDNLTTLASKLFGVPIALISLIDEHRQWFKSRVGLDVVETAREIAFCDHAIRKHETMVVPDATLDPRFATNPLVTGPPDIRFYCGVPLRSPEGHGLGTLCLIDRAPRTLSASDRKTLEVLARQVEVELEIRRRIVLLEDSLQVQEETQRGKELLAAMLVHDLRSPLTSINLLQHYLRDQSATEDEAFDELSDEIARMQRMIADVLDICIAETSALQLRRCSFSLDALIRKLDTRIVRLARQRDQSVVLDLPAEPVLIDGDPELVERVLTNILGNAVSHGPAGKPITVRLRTEGATSVIEIIDEGATIPDAARAAIFDPFVQLVHGSQKRGYGLGLAFSRLAIDAHHGTITVEPRLPHGNSFRIAIPLA